MKETLTKEAFVAFMYRQFGDDFEPYTWEDIFEEMAEEYDRIGSND